jgi:hypothetical protein
MRLLAPLSLILLAACGGSVGDGGGPTDPSGPTVPPSPVRVSMDTGQVLRVVDAGAVLGGNLGIWVAPSTLAPPTDRYVRERGARLVRGPGGNLSNNYCWVTQRVSDNNHVVWDDWSWGLRVEQYLVFVSRVGGRPLYSLNPFDHTIDGQRHSAVEEARALVRYFVSRGQSGAYYEVGNENDGEWNRMLSPPEYVEAFVRLAEAVKDEDPSARMMGPVGSGESPSWRNGFLDGLAARGKVGLLDYFSFHYYGGWISGSNSAGIDLSTPQRIPGFVADIRRKLARVGAPDAGVALTEYNAAIWDDGTTRGQLSIEQALWLADTAGVLFRAVDAGNVWIDLSGDDPHALLSDQSSPPAPTANYWPMLLVGRTLGFGRRDPSVSVVETSVDLPASRATAYAALGSDGRLAILMVNKGEPLSASISLGGRGCSPVEGLRVDPETHAAGNGPAGHTATCASGTVTTDLPRLSAVGLVLN